MSSVVFYKDSADTFECDVKIEGASYGKSKTRLVLEFKDRTLMFPGFIKEGHVSIGIPKLTDINDEGGKAILEVIADSTYFEAWTSDFELKNKKSVAIAEIKINSEASNIVVENISKHQPSQEPIQKLKPKSIYKENCTKKNKKFAIQTFKKFNLLSENKIKQSKKELSNYKPSPMIKKWADTVFDDSNTLYAKYCMMQLQKSL